MTLEKLAKLADVSTSTVSKAFSGSHDISEATRQKVFQTAKEQGCYEKYYKGSYPRRIIAVICPEIQSEYYGTIVTRLEEGIRQKEASMILSLSHFDSKMEKELFEYHSYFQKADGILLIGSASAISNRNRIPCVAVCPKQMKATGVDFVGIELGSAMSEAIAYLKDLGHKKIGFLGENLTDIKRELFLFAMEQNRLPINPEYMIMSRKRFEDAGFCSMEELFSRGNLPTAIMAAYDYMALGAVYSIRKHGLRVPEDISVIGMDNISVSSYLDVGLTSIRTNVEEMCNIALALLWKKIETPFYTVRQTITVSGELVVRQSTGAICKQEQQ